MDMNFKKVNTEEEFKKNLFPKLFIIYDLINREIHFKYTLTLQKDKSMTLQFFYNKKEIYFYREKFIGDERILRYYNIPFYQKDVLGYICNVINGNLVRWKHKF